MGRGVSVPRSAAAVAYRETDEYAEVDWKGYIEDLVYTLQESWPSLLPDDEWIGREDHIIASNSHAAVGVSEYGGVTALWIVPYYARSRYYYGEVPWSELAKAPLADHWIDQIAPKFKELFGHVQKLGTMSNGVPVYRRIS